MEAISDSLRRELRPFGVRVVVVEPGPIDTPIWKKNLTRRDEIFASFPERLRGLYEKGMNRFLRMAEESAAAAVPVTVTSRIIEKALLHPRPKRRYLAGRRSLILQVALVSLLPTRLMDWLIARMMDH